MGRSDPFALTPDTSAYVPREATERALDALAAAVRRGDPALLVGAPGVGKTLLLHLLAERAGAGLRPVYLPNPRLEPSELCAWVATGFGAPAGEDDPSLLMRAWLGHLREQDAGCLLLVDDADAMPDATLRWLAALAAESRGALRLALAALDGPAAANLTRLLGGAAAVRLDAPLTAEESAEYVAWRLRHADAPEPLRALFDATALAALHRVAAGNPRRLHLAALAIERGRPPDVLEDEIEEDLEGAGTSAAPPASAAPTDAAHAAALHEVRRTPEPQTSAAVSEPARSAQPAPPTRRSRAARPPSGAPRQRALLRIALTALAIALAAALGWWLQDRSLPEPHAAGVTDAPAEATSADVGP
jgi:MSHA biogenesis protein MshM